MRLGVSGREIDETSPKAQTWLDRAASMWEIEGLSMDDGWRVGGREDGAAGLIGNRLKKSKLDKWLQVVDSFACYPGPRMVYELVPEGEEYVIPVWMVPGWKVTSNLKALSGGTEDRSLRRRALCRTRPDRINWDVVGESKRVGSGEILTNASGVRSDMFVEECVTGKLGILRETWWGGAEEGWVGAVEWLPGHFEAERRSAGWNKFKEEGNSWPMVLPNFQRWCEIRCDRLQAVRGYKERPRKPRPGEGCIWVWGRRQEAGGVALPRGVPPSRFAAEVSADLVDRLSAWWEGGGKVLIASDGSLKKVRMPGRKELVPQGSTGWVYGLAPADFPEDEPNDAMCAVEWLGSSGKAIDLSRWMTPSSFICETAAAAGAIANLAQACVQGIRLPGRVVVYSDNAGMVQVLQGLPTRKHNAWRKTVGVGWWGMIKRGLLALTRRGGTWQAVWVRSHAERRRKPGEAWAAVEWGNGLADRAADQPEGRLEYGSVTNPITPVKWWSALPGRMPEELTDTLSRNVRRMSQETDTAEYLWRRQAIKKPDKDKPVVDWRTRVSWDWRVFQGWKERQTPPKRKRRGKKGQEAPITAAEDFMFRVTAQRPVGGLTVFRSKLWWGLLLDEHKRTRGRKLEGSVSRYKARMVAAGWVEGGGGAPPDSRTACGECETKRATVWCEKCGNWYHSKCIPGLDWKDTRAIWCPECLDESNREEEGQRGRCSLCSQEVWGGGSAWHVLSRCSNAILTAHRARLTASFLAVVTEVSEEMAVGGGDDGPALGGFFSLDPDGGWIAPTGWVGQGGSLDGTRINPWYGLFPQSWLEGGGESAGGAEQAGAAWERRRKQLQRLGDCCLRLCADMWSMACFLWTVADRPTPKKDKSKRGREWADKAAKMTKAQLEKDISIYRMSWKSKRQSVYAQGARAAWTLRQWWVEMKKDEDTRRVGARGGTKWGRSGQG